MEQAGLVVTNFTLEFYIRNSSHETNLVSILPKKICLFMGERRDWGVSFAQLSNWHSRIHNDKPFGRKNVPDPYVVGIGCYTYICLRCLHPMMQESTITCRLIFVARCFKATR